MEIQILGMLAETPIHAGIGQTAGVIDLPVAREATTDFPHIPGSGMKGAFRVWTNNLLGMNEENEENESVKKWFGQAKDGGGFEAAGTLLFGEARLALLPVRCTSDSYKLVTCPLIINRLQRDLVRGGVSGSWEALPEIESQNYLGFGLGDGVWLGLEEREFKRQNGADDWIGLFEKILIENTSNLKSKLVILSDQDFAWFARFALPVAMRNQLDENKVVKSGALWSEETLPADSVMWMTASERETGELKKFSKNFAKNPYIQIGGNETVGQGWFRLKLTGTPPSSDQAKSPEGKSHAEG